MALITTTITTDEKTWQTKFYETIFGSLDEVTVERSTDGYTKGILFEHKQNVTSNGRAKTLGQALIYLSRFNRDGIPVPSKICLVSQDEQKCYIYETENYIDFIENIEKYSNLKASDGIAGFEAGAVSQVIEFDISNASKMMNLIKFVQQAPKCVKVHINAHNVYGWSNYYYENASSHKQKPEKKAFFEELKNPRATLEQFIYPWTGKETDFRYIMDMLNDPMTQKKLGAFYTPPLYSKLAVELVKKAIERVPKGNDYIILDRCAGTGNLEMYLDDGNEDILSHVIVSTYELKEWMVLKDRFGKRVRYIIPPIPENPHQLPDLNTDGFLSGANALTRDIIDNEVVKKYIKDEKCTVILFENPPYIETTGIEFQKKEQGKESSIWSGFKYFLRQPSDSYIVFAPVKYWKSQHVISKKFIDGYAFNRARFHAKAEACVMCALWSNEDDTITNEFDLKAINIINKELVDEGTIKVKKVTDMFSEKYYDKRTFSTDTFDGIACELNGLETNKPQNKVRVSKNYNSNIIGYMIAQTFGLDNPRLGSSLLIGGMYNANGFYLRSDNFIDKLPMFAATRYPDHCNDWKVTSMIMKSADKSAQYIADVKSGKLDSFLFKTLFWTCVSHYPHIRSLNGSDGRLYLNQLCFDGDTLAKRKLDDFVSKGHNLSEEQTLLFNKMQNLLKMIKECDEYNPNFKYGLYQIDEEINIKIQVGYKSDGSPKMDFKYGDLNNLVKEIKLLSKRYYVDNLTDKLFEYELLK